MILNIYRDQSNVTENFTLKCCCFACCFKDVRVCRSAEGAASNHHLVTTLMSLHCSGEKQKTAQARTRAQWTSGAVAESIRRNPTAYQLELSTALGVGDEKS